MTVGAKTRANAALAAGSTARRSAIVVEKILDACDVRLDGPMPWDPQIRDERFFRRVLRDSSLGLGETYMDGWWDCERIDELVCRLLASDALRKLALRNKAIVAQARALSLLRQTVRRARVSVPAHYELGNELFELMLGRTMTYSCAYWPNSNNLDEAQDAKHELICRKLGIAAGDRVLDIGCGWGGFASYLANTRGCETVGVTISPAQAEFARRRCADLPVKILLLDYRSAEIEALRPFDRIVSVGMFEHVGRHNYRTFMRRVSDLLRPDGMFLLHTIGRHESDATDEWLCKYIFPDGSLPSAADIVRAADGLFLMEDWHNFRSDYDRTLLAWNDNFDASLGKLSITYDERSIRMWRFYLLSCAGNFRAGHRNQLWQIVYSKNGKSGVRVR